MSIDEIAPEALKLPLEQRVLLASTLWESIEGSYSASSSLSDEEAIALAKKRDTEIETGEVTPIEHDTLMSRLRK